MKKYAKKIVSLFLACASAVSTFTAFGASESLIDTETAKTTLDLGSWSSEAPVGANHVQGICLDETGTYMYASFTNMLVKLEVATGKVVATMTGMASGTHISGAHLGDITYYNGKIYGSLEYKT